MKLYILVTMSIILLSSCYTSSFNESGSLLFRGTNAYYNSNNEYMARLIFEEVASRKEYVSSAQKAYANTYLAKLNLKKGNINSAIRFLDIAENICKDFPYKYDILREFYLSHNNKDIAKKYNDLLIKWIEHRINEVDNETFDIDKLEFIDARSYVNGKYEREFFAMYDLKNPKETRVQLYKKYLKDKILYINQ